MLHLFIIAMLVSVALFSYTLAVLVFEGLDASITTTLYACNSAFVITALSVVVVLSLLQAPHLVLSSTGPTATKPGSKRRGIAPGSPRAPTSLTPRVPKLAPGHTPTAKQAALLDLSPAEKAKLVATHEDSFLETIAQSEIGTPVGTVLGGLHTAAALAKVKSLSAGMRGVYVFRNMLSGKWYLGCSTAGQMLERYCKHTGHFAAGGSKALRQAVAIYGLEHFAWAALTAVSGPALTLEESRLVWELEARLIASGLFPGYNLSGGGEVQSGFKRTEEEKQRLRDRIISAETRRRMQESSAWKRPGYLLFVDGSAVWFPSVSAAGKSIGVRGSSLLNRAFRSKKPGWLRGKYNWRYEDDKP